MTSPNFAPQIEQPPQSPLPEWIKERKQAERAEIALARGSGWKLHLNFDADNPGVVSRVQAFLEQTDPGLVRSFKIGHGGGKASDAPGKEATVYIGSKDAAVAVAAEIEEKLGEILLPPEGDTINDDVPLVGRVMARFDIGGVDPDFHQYGIRGLPLLNDDVRQRTWNPSNYSPEAAAQRAEALLRERYGTFYSGSLDQ